MPSSYERRKRLEIARMSDTVGIRHPVGLESGHRSRGTGALMTSNHRGLRLVEGLSARELGDEVVVVDQTTQQAHALSGPTAELWRALDAGRAPSLPGSEVDAAKRELTAL